MTVTFQSEDEATNWALAWLRDRSFLSFHVDSRDWMTPKELAGRAGISAPALCVRLAHPDCPQTPRKQGPTGRLIKIVVNDALLFWVSSPVRPGKAVAS